MVRQAQRTYDLLSYLNADERRERDCHWIPAFSLLSAPMVRSMIDSLYNITFVLQDPRFNGPAWRKSGLKKALESLSADEARYSGQPDWDAPLKDKRKNIEAAIRHDGFTLAEVQNHEAWATLGQYLRLGRGETLSDHQLFLKTFTYGVWREYSAQLHGGFDGLMELIPYLIRDALKEDFKNSMDEAFPRFMSHHMFRAALILLCIITEVQSYFLFKDANINTRIHKIWNALLQVFEVKELYNDHYAKLMLDKGIVP